jgi:hypothetical protein
VSVAGVELVSLEREEDDHDTAIAIEPSELPEEIIAAFELQFPGAHLIEAELSLDDGQPEYDLGASCGDSVFEVSFTPGGQIIETEEEIDESKLPQALREWLQLNYPGAEIDDVSMVVEDGVTNYEVAFDNGGEMMEGTFAVDSPTTPSENPVPAEPDDADRGFAQSETAGADETREELASADADALAGADGTSDAAIGGENQSPQPEATPPAEPAGGENDATDPVLSGVAPSDTAQESPAVLLAKAAQEIVAGTTAGIGVHQLAGVLSDALPIDAVVVERSMQKILAEIDSLARDLLAKATDGDSATVLAPQLAQLALLAALLIGTQLSLLRLRRQRSSVPVLAFNAANSSWSWVVGAPPRKPG